MDTRCEEGLRRGGSAVSPKASSRLMVAGGVMRWPSSHKERSNIGFCRRNLLHDLIILVIVKHLCSQFLLKETLFKKSLRFESVVARCHKLRCA